MFLACTLAACSNKKDHRAQLEQLDAAHQQCLDAGVGMMDCSYRYSKQMDSMLNVVYKDLMSVSSKDAKNKLRMEERSWIQKRDAELKKIYSDISRQRQMEDFVPQDARMMAYDAEAAVIRKRVVELIDAYEKE